MRLKEVFKIVSIMALISSLISFAGVTTDLIEQDPLTSLKTLVHKPTYKILADVSTLTQCEEIFINLQNASRAFAYLKELEGDETKIDFNAIEQSEEEITKNIKYLRVKSTSIIDCLSQDKIIKALTQAVQALSNLEQEHKNPNVIKKRYASLRNTYGNLISIYESSEEITKFKEEMLLGINSKLLEGGKDLALYQDDQYIMELLSMVSNAEKKLSEIGKKELIKRESSTITPQSTNLVENTKTEILKDSFFKKRGRSATINNTVKDKKNKQPSHVIGTGFSPSIQNEFNVHLTKIRSQSFLTQTLEKEKK
ncbi:MAG: hypothetical protein H0U27_06550 [Nitrosopumilus sp.]|nr:hypothetical protein [Nitrosopumilus sp.]